MLLFGSMDIELVDSTKAVPPALRDGGTGRRPRARRRRAREPRRIDLTPGPGRPHRGSRAALPARDGQGVPPHPRGRDHARQAHRGGQGRGDRAPSCPPPWPSTRSAPSATSCARTSSRSRTWSTTPRRSSPRRRKPTLRRSVIRELGNVDRLLREREKLTRPGATAQGQDRGAQEAQGRAAVEEARGAGPSQAGERSSQPSAD